MKAAVGKKNLLPYKIFAIIINILLILSTTRHIIYKNNIYQKAPMDFFPCWFFFILNGLGIIISFYLIFKPQRLELLVIFYLIMKKHNEETYIAASNKTLDLRNYQSLSQRDKEWIKLVLKETKYDEIANPYKVTSWTVRNLLMKIYKTLGVGDRIGLMATYSNCTVICNQQDFEKWKKMKVDEIEKQ